MCVNLGQGFLAVVTIHRHEENKSMSVKFLGSSGFKHFPHLQTCNNFPGTPPFRCFLCPRGSIFVQSSSYMLFSHYCASVRRPLKKWVFREARRFQGSGKILTWRYPGLWSSQKPCWREHLMTNQRWMRYIIPSIIYGSSISFSKCGLDTRFSAKFAVFYATAGSRSQLPTQRDTVRHASAEERCRVLLFL